MTLRGKIYEVIFGTETPAGRNFDLVLIGVILASVGIVMLDSLDLLQQFHPWFYRLEWVFTVIFTLEYLTRIYCSPNPWRYMRSFYGIIDLLSILPTYVTLLHPDAGALAIIRLMRVLRVFRVLKLLRYLSEANVLMRSLLASWRKIFLFFVTVLVLITIFGSIMFVLEGPENGFTSSPKSIYWTIVTITTVGYGDITPQTSMGQVVAAMAMLLGYSIIAVPTGILTAELAHEISRERGNRSCSNCNHAGHDSDAAFCKRCGSPFR